MTDGIEVTGGVGGLEVRCDDLGQTARALQQTSAQLLDAALHARGVVLDAGALSSAVLDPGGFARAEGAVLAAVLGPHGLVAAAGRLAEHSLALEAAVLRYLAADRLGAGLRELRQWAEGTALLLAVPGLTVLALSPAGDGMRHWLDGDDAAAFLAEHPGVAEDAAGALPTFLHDVLSLHLGGPASVEQETALLGLAYPTGSAQVVGRGTDVVAPPAPSGIGDLLSGLQHRDGLAHGPAQGEIDVRRITRTGTDGLPRTSWIVDLPGTKDWQIDPRRHRSHLNDLATNLDAMSGAHCARVDGVTRALALAGVGRDDPVMLVGHSQGGLVAMRAAEQYAADGSFNVTHVVTAGSPTARMPVPPSVNVLALENRYDVVPQLDATPPPDQRNRVTVVLDAQSRDGGANHSLARTYVPAARRLDAEGAEWSLQGWRDSAGAFLVPADEPAEVRTTVWDIRNAP